jgi:hypothetical protein
MLLPALTTLGYSLPELLACGIALAMLWTAARPGKSQRLGLIGVGLVLVCALMQLALGLYQNWMIHAAATDSAMQISHVFARLSILRMLINCVSLGGLIVVAWGLCLATRMPLSARHDIV